MIDRVLCWLFGHDVEELWIGDEFGGVFCVRCRARSLMPCPPVKASR